MVRSDPPPHGSTADDRRCSSATSGRAQLDRRLAESHDDEVAVRDDDEVLALVAVCREGARVVPPQPPVGAVAELLLGRHRHGRAGMVDPALGQEALALPHAVAEVEVAEAGEVERRAVEERRADERAGVVEAWVGAASSRAGRRGARCRKRPHARLAAAHDVAHDAADDVRGARGVVPHRARRVVEREAGGERGHVVLAARRTASRSRRTRRRPRSPRRTAGPSASRAAAGR